MKVKFKLDATHESMPASIDAELDMNPQELITYVKDITPLVKEFIAVRRKSVEVSEKNYELSREEFENEINQQNHKKDIQCSKD